MIDYVYIMVAFGGIALFTGIIIVMCWSVMVRWMIQTFEKLINIMDPYHFPE